MTQISIPAWSQDLQTQLMAAIDAAWKIIDTSDDPAAVRKARDKARACGELAAVARKVAAMTGLAARRPVAQPLPAPESPTTAVAAQVEHARRALDRLKGGGRARL